MTAHRIELAASFTRIVELPRVDPNLAAPIDFVVPGPPQVRLSFSVDSADVEAHWEAEVSEAMFEALRRDDLESLFSDGEIGSETATVYRCGGLALRRTLELMCFVWWLESAKEHLFASKGVKWRVVGSDWVPWPIKLQSTVRGVGRRPFDMQACEHIQSLLDTRYVPLAGFRHVLRASRDDSPRHMIIDAAIGAELAVKDALCRLHPALSELLLRLPSPPLDKLYGSVLEHYGGKRSPYLRPLRAVMKARNDLVHKHGDTEDLPTPQEAIDLCADTRRALWHLASLLREHDRHVEYFRWPLG